jgi:precorrin-3B methylase
VQACLRKREALNRRPIPEWYTHMSVNSFSNKGRVIIIGLGVMVPDHVTPQAVRALYKCSKIYSIVQEPADTWYPRRGAQATPVIINLLASYTEGVQRLQNYEKAAKTVLSDCGPDTIIGYVTYGNPMSYDSVAQTILRDAKKLGVEVEIIPGVSSVDTISCDLAVDIAPGIQVYEASWMLACRIPIRTDVQLLLLQVGSFGSLLTHYSKRRDGSSLGELVSYLLQFYPAAHIGVLVRSTGHAGRPAAFSRLGIERLSLAGPEELSGASLYIPVVEEARVDTDVVSRMLEA